MNGPRVHQPLESQGFNVASETALSSVLELLDTAAALFRDGTVFEGMTYLTMNLSRLRRRCSSQAWSGLSRSTLRAHPLHEFVQQDPFTSHSYRKPRGYSGDAALLDLIYNPDTPPRDITKLGLSVWRYTINAAEPTAVRERKTILAREIDNVCRTVSTPRVFSVACGHLREGDGCEPLCAGCFLRDGAAFLALDQDPQSLAVVDAAYGHFGVRTIQVSIRSVLTGKMPFHDFDLIYAAGLFDYLSTPLARRLTLELFRLLRPEGKLLLANFMPGNASIGYMEGYMDWHLIYRGEDEIESFLDEISQSDLLARRLYRGANSHIAYLEAVKAPQASGSYVGDVKRTGVAGRGHGGRE